MKLATSFNFIMSLNLFSHHVAWTNIAHSVNQLGDLRVFFLNMLCESLNCLHENYNLFFQWSSLGHHDCCNFTNWAYRRLLRRSWIWQLSLYSFYFLICPLVLVIEYLVASQLGKILSSFAPSYLCFRCFVASGLDKMPLLFASLCLCFGCLLASWIDKTPPLFASSCLRFWWLHGLIKYHICLPYNE